MWLVPLSCMFEFSIDGVEQLVVLCESLFFSPPLYLGSPKYNTNIKLLPSSTMPIEVKFSTTNIRIFNINT